MMLVKTGDRFRVGDKVRMQDDLGDGKREYIASIVSINSRQALQIEGQMVYDFHLVDGVVQPGQEDIIETAQITPVPRYMDVEVFASMGYLQECNRLFFHSHGLALEMAIGYDRDYVKELLQKRGVQFGDEALDTCMTLIGVIGLDKDHFVGAFWDYRDDPEGIIFEAPLPNAHKAAMVDAEWFDHLPARTELFGSSVQPVHLEPEPEPEPEMTEAEVEAYNDQR